MTDYSNDLRPLPLGKLACRYPYAPQILVGHPPQDAGWVRVADLGALTTGLLREAMQTMGLARRYPLQDGRTLGSSFALITSSALSGAIVRLASGEGLPRMSPEITWWRMKPTANVTEVAVESAEIVPAPPLAEAAPADLAEARRALWESRETLFHAVLQLTRAPVRAQWALVESAIAGCLMELCRPDYGAAIRSVEALFADGDVLWRSRPRFWQFQWQGQYHTAFTRRVCCYNFKRQNQERGDEGYCGSMCPLLPPSERLQDAVRALEHNCN